jgi:hypothetical protein
LISQSRGLGDVYKRQTQMYANRAVNLPDTTQQQAE